MITTILFDLDGTITESGPGIIRSVQYALEKLGRPEENPEMLRAFVGPPLIDGFMDYAGLDRDTAEKAVTLYRERYSTKGIFEVSLYPGIKEMLRELEERGMRLAVASSKPDVFVKQILDHCEIDGFFESVTGSSLTENDAGKPHIITKALDRLSMLDRKSEVIMVGDRKYDILGAHAVGILSIGVTYGYGTREELLSAGVDAIADNIEGVVRAVLSLR